MTSSIQKQFEESTLTVNSSLRKLNHKQNFSLHGQNLFFLKED